MTTSLFKPKEYCGQSASTKAKFCCHLKDKNIFYIIYQNPFPLEIFKGGLVLQQLPREDDNIY